MRRIILRSTRNAGGATMKLKNDMIGSWYTITASRPISESRSRPIAVTIRVMTWLPAARGASQFEARARGGASRGQPRHELGGMPLRKERDVLVDQRVEHLPL